MGATRITNTNYVEMIIPKHMFYIESITIQPNTRKGGEDNAILYCNPQPVIVRKEFLKGQKFIISYINDWKPVIIGVIE